MGVVYRARQKSLNRPVALKLLAPGRERDPAFADRFAREARALAALNHPNIVTVHDFGFAPTASTGQPEGFYFLLMEFVDGVNLRQAMRAGRFTPEQALAIVPPVCTALQFAHERGIVHRDIKPENLLLDKEGRIKIADFGIARILSDTPPLDGSGQPASGSRTGPSLTAHSAAGTPQYMAPEQRDSAAGSDHRADIYSLGVVLYELLTGELPGARLQPPSHKVQVDVRLDEIVLRALAVQPELRYATAAEFRTELDSVTVRPSPPHPPDTQPPPAPRLLKTGAALIHTPDELATFYGQFWAMRNRGQLVLDERRLTYVVNGVQYVIPLDTIRDVSIGQYPRNMNPFGLEMLSVTHDVDGQLHQRFIAPNEGLLSWPSSRSARLAEWHVTLRDAVARVSGREPDFTPRSQLKVPPGHPGAASALITAFLIPILVSIVLANTSGRSSPLPFIAGYASSFIAFLVAVGGGYRVRQTLPSGDDQGPSTRPWSRIVGMLLLLAGLALPVVISSWTASRHDLPTAQRIREIQVTRAEESRLQQGVALQPPPPTASDPDANPGTSEALSIHLARSLASASEHRANLERALSQTTSRPPRWQDFLPSLPLILAGALLLRPPGGAQLSAPPRRWMQWTGASCLILGTPLLAFGVWIAVQIANDRSWNPVPAEAVLTFTTWIGSVLLLISGTTLLALARPHTCSHSWRRILALTLPALLASTALAGLLGISRVRSGFSTSPPTGVSRLAIEPLRQEDNRIIVRVFATVPDNPVQLRVALDGPTLSDAAFEQIALHRDPPFTEARSGQPSGNRPTRFLPQGDHTWEVAFVFPDAAAAVETYRNLQRQEWGGAGLGTWPLFETIASNGGTYRAAIEVAPAQTMGSPDWVSITGSSSFNESSLRLQWSLTVGAPGFAQFALGSRLSSIPTFAPPSQGETVEVTIDQLANDQVRIRTVLPGASTTQEVSGDFGTIAQAILGSTCWGAQGSRADLFQLCSIQGEPLQMRIHSITPGRTPAPVWRWILMVLPFLVLFLLAGLVLAFLAGGRARQMAVVLGIPLLLLLVSAVLIAGWMTVWQHKRPLPIPPVTIERPIW